MLNLITGFGDCLVVETTVWYEWVGWRNDSFGMNGRPLEMVFEFDRLRNFSAMYLHTNNIYSQKVQFSDSRTQPIVEVMPVAGAEPCTIDHSGLRTVVVNQ
ncbi:unnamed protein product [Nezara viridula]|uniref:Discoidin domain-containing protein n=1 Tax=Nezara viridula TaxID=85310 RepID=A0A9P0EE53_NEZVI|nr:unnamed protein product [Nezara viridula]